MVNILTIAASIGPLLGSAEAVSTPAPCFGPEYYAIELVTTRNVPGTGRSTGTADVAISATSPFSVSVGADGSYVYDVSVRLERTRSPRDGHLVAWVTTPNLDQTVRLGTLDENLTAEGSVRWNQFLVVVTWESTDDPQQGTWSGPVAFRGLSRSGMLHTMVGHGALQQENCASWGFSD